MRSQKKWLHHNHSGILMMRHGTGCSLCDKKYIRQIEQDKKIVYLDGLIRENNNVTPVA